MKPTLSLKLLGQFFNHQLFAMISKIPLFVFVLVSFQILSLHGDAGVDDYLDKICNAPALAGKGNERIREVEVAKPSHAFLSRILTSVLAVCEGNQVVYRFEVEEPSKDDKVMEAARQAIGETSPEAVEAAKAELVKLLKKNTSLNVPLDSDDWLVRFLRLRKYDVPATYELIKNYYNFKAQNPKLFNGLTPSKLNKLAENNCVVTMPKRDQDGKRVSILTPRNFDPKNYTAIDAFKYNIVLAELSSYEPGTQITGIQFVVDASGMTMDHVKLFNPILARKWINYKLYAAPYNYEKVHVIKHSRAFWALWKIASPFLTKELRNKVYFHGNNMKSLHRHITPAALPTEYGGVLPMPTFTPTEWNTLLTAFDVEYTKLNTYGVKKN